MTHYEIKIQALRRKLIDKKLSPRDCETLQRLYKSLCVVYPYGFCEREKGKPDYLLKSVIFGNYSYDLKCVRVYLRWKYLVESGVIANDMYSYYKWWECYRASELEYWCPAMYDECVRIVNSDRARKKRLRNRIENIINDGEGYFLTLTFNDETFKNTDAKTRRTYVSRFLKSISDNYIANIDFGKQKGREHYHAVIHCSELKDISFIYHKKYKWINLENDVCAAWSKYGFYSVKSCKVIDKDIHKLSWYVSKLSNHATKETTKRNAMIYSR